MNLLSIKGLSLRYGDKLIFEDIDVYINQGDRIALVAKNGTGKSTLFRIITGDDAVPTETKIELHADAKVGYLPQDILLDPELTIKQVIYKQGSEKFEALERYNMANLTAETDAIEKSIEEMDRLGLWDLESRMQQILGKLNIYDLDQKVSQLSGGQKKRVALSVLLLEEPQLILMDEPTNHLDPDMIEWLEDYLLSRNLTLLLITHDRYFLDKVCDSIIELDNGKLQKYQGNYAYYIEKKQEQLERDESYNAKMKNLYRREKEWMSRQPQARTTKAKSRIRNFDTIEESANMRREDEHVTLETVENRLGNKILEFHNATKAFGKKKILEKFDYKFKRHDKIGIVGANGVGKTTFLELILGNLSLDRGEIIIGVTVKIAYYQQEVIPEHLQEKRMIEYIKDMAEHIPLKGGKSYTAAQMLERFLFPKSQHYVKIKKLSGGEKRRLTLIRTLMRNPNFLILDEPTNDLDILTLNILQTFIEEFEGCVLVVSHDRYFMDHCVDHLFIFEGEGVIRDFHGTYSEYRMQLSDKIQADREASAKIKERNTKTTQKEKTQEKKLSYNEQRELKRVVAQMPKLEHKKTELTEKLQENLEYTELEKINKELTETIAELDQCHEIWFDLMSKIE